MLFPLLTLELIARIEGFQLRFNAARMEAARALPGNPYQIEMRYFGGALAGKTRSPLLKGKNRLHAFRAADALYLGDALAFFRDDNLRCSLSVLFGEMTPGLFRRLTEAGLWSGGSGTVCCIAVPDARNGAPAPPPGVTIREAGDREGERRLYLDLFQQAFSERGPESHPDYLPFQWAEDSLPGGRRYIAFHEGVPVAMASFPILDRVGYFGTAGVLPAWRGRGVQRALIEQRLRDAPSLGCDLVIGGGSLFSTTHRNFERAGLREIPLGSGWADAEAG